MQESAGQLLRALVATGGQLPAWQLPPNVQPAAQQLEADGYTLHRTAQGTLQLAAGPAVLTEEELRLFLPPKASLRFWPATGSTNAEARRWAAEDAPQGALAAAASQQSGRGRLGRGFQSPPGGIYMSTLLWYPPPLPSPGLITAGVAVAVCRAVQRLCGISLAIKWVNDLLYTGRKCCGILVETMTGLRPNTGEAAVIVGIGLNYAAMAGSFAPPLAQTATSLYPGGQPAVPPGAVCAAIYAELLALLGNADPRAMLPEYRQRSAVLGRRIEVLASPPYPAQAVAIDDDARLVVQPDTGDKRVLSMDEISVRL